MVRRLTNKQIRDKLRARKCQGGRCEIRLSVKRSRLVSQALRLRLINKLEAHGESKDVINRRKVVAFVELMNKFIITLAKNKKIKPPSNAEKLKFIKGMMEHIDPNKTYNYSTKRAFKYTRLHYEQMYPGGVRSILRAYYR